MTALASLVAGHHTAAAIHRRLPSHKSSGALAPVPVPLSNGHVTQGLHADPLADSQQSSATGAVCSRAYGGGENSGGQDFTRGGGALDGVQGQDDMHPSDHPEGQPSVQPDGEASEGRSASPQQQEVPREEDYFQGTAADDVKAADGAERGQHCIAGSAASVGRPRCASIKRLRSYVTDVISQSDHT